MAALTFARVTDERTADAWRRVHNEIIPSDPLTLDQVVGRTATYTLDLASLGDVVVGCSTVRPAADNAPVTVIVRILPAFRKRGYGSTFLSHALSRARELDAVNVQTIVHASNSDGMDFAVRRGFVETARYTMEGDTVPYVHLAARLDDLTTR